MATGKSFWSQRQKFEQLTVPALSLLGGVILTVLVLIPQINKAIVARKETLELAEKIKITKEKASLLGNLDTAELSIRSSKMVQVLPSDEDLGYFLTAIRSNARRAGTIYQGVELVPGTVTRKSAAGVPPIARKKVLVRPDEDSVNLLVSLTGNIDTLRQFLFELEQSIPLSSLEEFSFGRDEAEAFLTARVNLKYFYQPVPTSIGEITQPVQVITAAEEQVYGKLLELKEPDIVQLPRVPTGNLDLLY